MYAGCGSLVRSVLYLLYEINPTRYTMYAVISFRLFRYIRVVCLLVVYSYQVWMMVWGVACGGMCISVICVYITITRR